MIEDALQAHVDAGDVVSLLADRQVLGPGVASWVADSGQTWVHLTGHASGARDGAVFQWLLYVPGVTGILRTVQVAPAVTIATPTGTKQ